MEGDNRRTSIYDLTGLRVHPDGFRVHQTQRNLRLGTNRHTSQDSRGWIADDAGGIIPNYKTFQRTPSSDPEHLKTLVAAELESGESGESGEEITFSAKGKQKDMSNLRRALKRKKFTEDDNYLSSLSQTRESSNGIPQMPSQDLLKNIHHLAATYYDTNGLLINASKRYRKAKKLRRHEVLSEPTLTGVQITKDDHMNATEQITVEDDFVQRRRKVNRDMYRVLDGSVLVAVGVFTEEIVKKLLQGRDNMTQRQAEVSCSDDGAGGRSSHDAASTTSDEGGQLDDSIE